MGSIISKIKTDNDEVYAIQKHIDSIEMSKQSYFYQAISTIMCKNIFSGTSNEDLCGCYIMTLGVIDECRKLGIGTKLLEQTYKELEQNFD